MRGFAVEASPPAAGTLIAYATGPGRLADDGFPGKNGVFTSALLAELRKPGLDIEEIFWNARKTVAESTNRRQVPWVSTSLTDKIILRPEDPTTCLDLVEAPGQSAVTSGLGLGRVKWKEEIMEPVLIWNNGERDGGGFSFRNCSGGGAVDVAIGEADLEMYASALVAHFLQGKTGALEEFHKVALGYAPKGEAKLTFRGIGSMLEARRTKDVYVRVTGTDSVSIIRDEVAVLLVATRDAMIGMDPEVWDEAWGDRPGDSRIGREITWWELAGSGKLRIHPAVESFAELADLIDSAADEVSWDRVLEEDSEAILARAAYSLIVADKPEHIELAEGMLMRANVANSADLDVARLESEKKRDRWKEEDLARLEASADRGRYWPLSRLYELAAIMPRRIAGKIRHNYRKSLAQSPPASSEETRFRKDDLILAPDSPQFMVVNALYQDQAVGMAKTLNFLGCLLEDDTHTKSDRLDILEQGLVRMNIPFEDLKNDMFVHEAFQYLFQGFNLPLGMEAGDQLFWGSVGRQDPEVSSLVHSLQAYLDTALLDPHARCEMALIPDVVLSGQSTEPLQVVSAMMMPVPDDAVPPANSRYAAALRAKNEVRIILEKAVFVKGARHTRKKMEQGHKKLDEGNEFLQRSEGVGEADLDKAILAFNRAETIFQEARDTAFKIEHSKPKVRVH